MLVLSTESKTELNNWKYHVTLQAKCSTSYKKSVTFFLSVQNADKVDPLLGSTVDLTSFLYRKCHYCYSVHLVQNFLTFRHA